MGVVQMTFRTILLCAATGVLVATGVEADQSLDEKMRAVMPTEEEDRWLQIDWHTNIAEARQEAQRQHKPVLLWVMNGNPLGCG
jgi:hypothetical protein